MSSSSGRISEVQGLRGIAVAAVVLFHARIPGLHGGFLGVDVFFVISGFVISLMLKRDITAGTFRFGDFYSRRAWRLMPALAVTLIASGLLFGILVPTALEGNLWQSLVAAAFGVSNFYFNGKLDYFDGGVSNPALHTWSLGVEEQFYLVFPFFLLILHRFGRGLGAPWRVLLGVSIIGFGAAVYQTQAKSDVAFFLTWFRAWEFLTGSVIAFAFWGPAGTGFSVLTARWASWCGFVLLMLSLLLYREKYVFPGIGALAPVFGTALLIVGASSGGLINRLLASKPFTLAGDMSYSIYLAHWPVTCAIGLFVPLEKLSFAILAMACSVASGYALWRGVEMPLRRGFRGRIAGGAAAWLVPLAMGCTALGSFAFVSVGDAFWRHNPKALAYFENGRQTTDFRRERCFLTLKSTISNYDFAECMPQHGNSPTLLILGDSLAANITQELQRRLPGVDVQQATAVEYKPGLPGPQWPATTAALDKLVHQKLHDAAVKPQILLYARWDADDLPALKALVVNLVERGFKVSVLGPSPQFYVALPFLAGYGEMLGVDLVPLMTKVDRFALDQAFAAQLPADSYVSMMSILCKAGGNQPLASNCITRIGNDLMYFDKLHYTRVGARFLSEQLPLDRWSIH
ncbi:MAG: acyltransferase [Alphaproteobacteria bacterium]|nr:MAG: acyltransferase [Alphaproteobacteria bacterium]